MIEPPTFKLMLTDPPFGTGKKQAIHGNSYHDPSDTDASLSILRKWGEKMHPDGTTVVICDYRMLNGVLDTLDLFTFRGEVIWTFGLGRPRTSWWPNRHNHMLTFTWSKSSGLFDPTAIPREPRRALKPGYPDDKPAGSVWDLTMSNTDSERVGYPNQKPVKILRPFVLAHTVPGDLVVDPFAGSASSGAAALLEGRKFLGVDLNPQAIDIGTKRLEGMG